MILAVDLTLAIGFTVKMDGQARDDRDSFLKVYLLMIDGARIVQVTNTYGQIKFYVKPGV